MRYKLAIFDMDGTILNSLEDLADSLNYVLSVHGYPKRTLEEVRNFVGNGIRKLVERGVPEPVDSSRLDQLCQEHKDYYKLHCADKTRPYDGIPELLRNLRQAGCRTAVVSNKADYAVQALCNNYFEGLFDTAVGEKPSVLKKPAPDSVNEVLKRLHIAREDAVYIGDSDVDIETARNAGMDSIIVDWGFRERVFLIEKGATLIVSAPKEVEKLILTD